MHCFLCTAMQCDPIYIHSIDYIMLDQIDYDCKKHIFYFILKNHIYITLEHSFKLKRKVRRKKVGKSKKDKVLAGWQPNRR